MYDGWNLVLALLVSTMLEETQYNVTLQPALSCDVCGGSFKSEVLSGLQYSDEQDRGSKAQPDIVDSLSTWDAERRLSAGERQKRKALYRTFREGKR